MTSAETIREITRKHLSENNGVVMGQCLSAVGWVGGTIPELPGHPNLVELSMDDTCGCGIAVGYALAGRDPIFICRYQGFMWYNSTDFINFGAKAEEMWGYKIRIFIRSIAHELGAGPVAGGAHHGIITRVPKFPVCAPVTPKEYESAWEYSRTHYGPLYVSECKKCFAIDYEMENIIKPDADITILAISVTRLSALEAIRILEKQGIVCNLIHLVWLKPLLIQPDALNAIRMSRCGALIVDMDFEDGYSKCIAYELMHQTDKKARVIGLEERTSGFAAHLDNPPPSSERICEYVKKVVSSK
ncbi:MAG: hypothetical protein A3B86_02135 [Candidatus Yanofskybacteria bacterium RIFCSPHIGHO2_02_FULL_38_22b]|uniref:Uncharacterized protein n=1 Tax=Candidatus Yanofskybacteria bacterium RIFCSPHIGHO2_02_FULL_38_22b TaxID=1802673 RepID=A0A1F8F2S2_9BACT|nr:MAG: hypothetical protein A2816_03010 [Candidatus Yanofskybacteria bacterium RIFCSPHIGHO2_01_FULL_39_44]OGN06920.1 MAG: hypothetical protein A3B86_02135 [Candidatus Yanofskybacteria bacterium RIFCSPHIGHO2_02_FULL_38_22b]OGN20676.1 MAG: hypothetical protein A2910_02680 [Candidatus Yanofskybacteria bacterium RIFCSPLOWO2_01_FULL_39_28]